MESTSKNNGGGMKKDINNQNDKFIKFKEVMQIVGLSRTTLYSLIKNNKFPKQIKPSGTRSSVWYLNEVKDWMQEQKDQRN